MNAGVLRACHCCGQVHVLPVLGAGQEAKCARCGSRLRGASHPRNRSRAAAFAIAAIILYPLGVGLPIMKIERVGHEHTTNIWNGVAELFAEGEWIVASVVLVCSIVAPMAKLSAMLVLSMPRVLRSPQHRALVYRLVEFIGRWGMVDVLLVALLVAAVKLGSWLEVTPGPGLIAFCTVVVLSLISTALFDPHAIWEDEG